MKQNHFPDVINGSPIRRSCLSNLVRGINRFRPNEGRKKERTNGAGISAFIFANRGWNGCGAAAVETQTRGGGAATTSIGRVPFVAREGEEANN